jgi:hypothetical protein
MKTRRVRGRPAGCAIRRRCYLRLERVSWASSLRRAGVGLSGRGLWEVVVRRRGQARLRRTLLLGLARAARLAPVVAARRQDDC